MSTCSQQPYFNLGKQKCGKSEILNLKDLFSFSFPSSLNVVVCSNIKLPDPYTLKGLKHELLILVPSLISKGYGQMSEESHIAHK